MGKVIKVSQGLSPTEISGMGLTDTQLRSSPIPVIISSGIELEIKNDAGNPLNVLDSHTTDGTQKTQIVDQIGTVIPPNGAVGKLLGVITRPANTNNYLVGSMIGTVQTLTNASLGLNGGGWIMEVKQETNIVSMAGCVLRYWLYNVTPTGMVADGSAFINSFANAYKRCASGYFDVIFDPLLAGSDCVIGKYQPNSEYICAVGSKDMFVAVQTLTAITAPLSGGILKFAFNVVKVQ